MCAKVLIFLITFVSVMKFTLLTVGKTTFPFVEEGLCLYEKRLGFYINYQRVEIPELKNAKALSFQQIKQKEGTLILKSVKANDTLILMDERGIQYDSIKWAEKMEGVSYAILCGNMVVPLIEKITMPVPFGREKRKYGKTQNESVAPGSAGS